MEIAFLRSLKSSHNIELQTIANTTPPSNVVTTPHAQGFISTLGVLTITQIGL